MPLTLDDIRTYCRNKPGHVTEGMPFQINLKADPEQAVEWRERYEGVTPGYHMNKRHWNTILLDGSVPATEIYRMIDHSYDLVAPASRARRERRGRTTGPRTMARTRSGRSRGRR